LNNLKIINGFLSQPDALNIHAFEKLYVALRFQEGRIYSEEEIANLPVVTASHPHYKEWLLRKNSCYKLKRYIKQHSKICNILEVGCGNGWLAAQLASVTKGSVTGIDINALELEQAWKVFNKKFNLNFIEGDIRDEILRDNKYDLIVFAASIQYFKSLKEILNTAAKYLTLQGEIHIIDTHLYKSCEIPLARLRSKIYFTEKGFPEMADHYFHHNIKDLEYFSFSVLHDPHSRINKLLFNKNPFHWIAVKNSYP
jgi:ubiquinone/menaquinone biosynthesis C-methylase UbiE